MILYYIIPLTGILLLTKGYTYLIGLIPESQETNFVLAFIPIAMKVVFNIVLANICITMMFILIRDSLNTKFIIEAEQKISLAIICVILLAFATAKIGIGLFMQSRIPPKVTKLNGTIQENNLEKYVEIDFKPKISAKSSEEDIRPKNKENFNTLLLKYEAEYLEATYKMETADIKKEVKEKGKPKNVWKAKRKYNVECENYVQRLTGHKKNIARQNVSYLLIYLSEILCVVFVFWKNALSN